MRQPLCIFLHCNPQHSHSHRPWSSSNRQIQIFIICLHILSDQTAVNYVVNWCYHFLISSFVPQYFQKTYFKWFFTLKLMLSLKISLKLIIIFCTLLFVIFEIESFLPVPQYFYQPDINNIACFMKILLNFPIFLFFR